MKPFSQSGCFDTLGDDADHDLVGDEAAALHDGFRLLADLGSGLDGGAQHVAGRELNQPAPLGKRLGLGSLAGPRRSEKDEVHRRLRPVPLSFAFLIRPSY